MSVFFDISAALDYQLNTMSSLPPVAWENKKYTPTQGTLFLRPVVLSGSTTTATLGDSGEDLSQGIYQVDVIAPASKGKNAAIVMADNIANHFKRGTVLTYNSRVVRVVNVQRRPAIIDGGWYQIPVEIIYKSYTQPRT